MVAELAAGRVTFRLFVLRDYSNSTGMLASLHHQNCDKVRDLMMMWERNSIALKADTLEIAMKFPSSTWG